MIRTAEILEAQARLKIEPSRSPETSPNVEQHEKPFTRKVILIFGASHIDPLGIGGASAFEFARLGAAAVGVTGSEKAESQGHQVKDRIETYGAQGIFLPGDVKDPKAIADTIAQMKNRYGKIDVLVNAAAVLRDRKQVDMTLGEWQEVIDTNLTPAFLTVQELVKQEAYAEGAAIVHVSSIVGMYGNPGQENYAAAKAGLIGLTMTQAFEMAELGGRVNAVAPGLIRTALTEKIVKRETSKSASERVIPLGEIGFPEQVASGIAFLADNNRAGYITGVILPIDGGLGAGLRTIGIVAEERIQHQRDIAKAVREAKQGQPA